MPRAEQPFIPKHVCQFDKQIKLERKLFQYFPPLFYHLRWPPLVSILDVEWQRLKKRPSSPQDSESLE